MLSHTSQERPPKPLFEYYLPRVRFGHAEHGAIALLYAGDTSRVHGSDESFRSNDRMIGHHFVLIRLRLLLMIVFIVSVHGESLKAT